MGDETRSRMDNRNDEQVIIPAPAPLSEMDGHYLEYIAGLKREIAAQRASIALRANAGVMCLQLRCYVVIELKVRDFEPGFLGQLNMYRNVMNAVLRHPDDKPTIGLLLVKGKNETTVRYSLEGYVNPIGVS